MKKIAIVSPGYAWFPCEPGPSRFFYIAKVFAAEGWDVDIYTVDFQHFQKRPRDIKTILEQKYPFNIHFVHAPAYKKNIDIRRIMSNSIVANSIIQEISPKIKEYDAVYCSIPSNRVAARLSTLCKEKGVPFVIDIEDLWPEAMAIVIKNDTIRNLLLHGMLIDAETAYKNASGVIGTSEDYTDRAFVRRNRDIPNETVYVGCDLSEFDSGVSQYIDSIEKKDGEIWVTYAGSISNSYDIKTLIDAAKLLRKDIIIQLLGTGSLKEELENYVKANDIDNVRFWGFVEYHKMAAALRKSDLVINSFVKGAPQSIVNKIGDYFASGKPVINTLENPICCDLINHNKVGVNVESENSKLLAETIENMISSPKIMNEMAYNSRALAERDFDRNNSYYRIVKLIESIING